MERGPLGLNPGRRQAAAGRRCLGRRNTAVAGRSALRRDPLQIAVNLTIKQIKRVGRGFTKLDSCGCGCCCAAAASTGKISPL
jgi:hypothetical protein